jgi:hypothetical protein
MATLVTLRATDQAGLDLLPEHDAYFDIEDREFDAAKRTLCLPFRQRVDQIVDVDGLPPPEPTRRTWRFAEYRMLQWLVWDEEQSQLTIHTVPGREHVVDVDRLEVEVEVTDEVDEHYRVRKGFIGESQQPWT